MADFKSNYKIIEFLGAIFHISMDDKGVIKVSRPPKFEVTQEMIDDEVLWPITKN